MGVALKSQWVDDSAVAVAEPVIRPDHQIADPVILFNREIAFARAMAWRFGHWLTQHIADQRIPMDSVMLEFTLLTTYVEVMLTAQVTWPDIAPKPAEQDYIHPAYQPLNEVDAAELGLYPIRKRNGKKIKPTDARFCLPGCAGKDADGAACQKPRAYGQRYCPACEDAARKQIRAWQRA